MYISREHLEAYSPSREHGICARLEATFRWSYCDFLKDVGIELKMYDVLTLCFLFPSWIYFFCQAAVDYRDGSGVLSPLLRPTFAWTNRERPIRELCRSATDLHCSLCLPFHHKHFSCRSWQLLACSWLQKLRRRLSQ